MINVVWGPLALDWVAAAVCLHHCLWFGHLLSPLNFFHACNVAQSDPTSDTMLCSCLEAMVISTSLVQSVFNQCVHKKPYITGCSLLVLYFPQVFYKSQGCTAAFDVSLENENALLLTFWNLPLLLAYYLLLPSRLALWWLYWHFD